MATTGGERQVEAIFEGGTALGLDPAGLLARFIARRDEAAFAAILTQHGPMVLATCRRILPNAADADDAFQATFLVLARQAGSIADPDRLAPWLHNVARRAAARSRTLAARRVRVEAGRAIPAVAAPPPAADAFELRSIFDDELARLPAKYRDPLVLCYLEGLTHDEAAARLACPVGTVRSRLATGRDRLRSRLARRGFAPGALAILSPPTTTHLVISRSLLVSTLRLVCTSSAGKAATSAALLAQGVLTTMLFAKIQTATVATLAVAATLAAGTAGVVIARQEPAARPRPVAVAPPQLDPGLLDSYEHDRELHARLKEEIADMSRRLEQLGFDQDQKVQQYLRLKEVLAIKQVEVEAVERAMREEVAKRDAARAPARSGPAAIPPVPRAPTDEQAATRLKALDGDLAAIAALGPAQQAPASPPGPQDRGARPSPAGEPQPSDQLEPAPTVQTVDGSPTILMVISGAHDRVTMINPATQQRATLRLAQPVETIAAKVLNEGMMSGNGQELIFLQMAAGQGKSGINKLAFFDRNAVRWFEHDLPQPATRIDLESAGAGSTLFGFSVVYQQPTREVFAFDAKDRSWPTWTLAEPVDGYIPSAVSGNHTVVYEADRFIGVYNQARKKWSTLELKANHQRPFLRGNVSNPMNPNLSQWHDGKLVIPEGDLIHIYDAETAEWTHLDTKDDK